MTEENARLVSTETAGFTRSTVFRRNRITAAAAPLSQQVWRIMSDSKKPMVDEKTEALIRKIFQRGNTVELKKINGKLHVVEIERKKQAQIDL